MKTRILLLATVIFSSALFFTSCKKEKGTTAEIDYTTETSVHSDDQSRFSSEIDAVANDADLVVELTSNFAGRMETEGISPICDATLAFDSVSNPKTITITYNGTNCQGNRTRTGVVVISMESAMRWKNAGAVLNVSFQNLKITRTSDNKSITINGTQSYTNVSGGLLINLPVLGTITHRISSSNMSVKFDDLSQRNWQVARQRVFSFDNGVNITTTGTHTEGSVTGITEWGTNRFGNSFTTAITEPLIVRQSCNFRLVTGKVQHKTLLYNAAVTFGLDANGNATTCPGAGAYYMKIVWNGPLGIPHTAILPY